jgi:hypothetical protein
MVRNSGPSVVLEAKRFVKSIRGTRYHDFPLLIRCETMVMEAAKSIDLVLTMTEYRECRRLRRNYIAAKEYLHMSTDVAPDALAGHLNEIRSVC